MESTQSTLNTSAYKFAYFEPENYSYYDYCDAYAINNETYANNGYIRQLDNASTMANERSTSLHMQQNAHSNSNSISDPTADCPQSNHSPVDYQVVWEDNVDLDNMTYEELLELGEVVGTQSRGLSQEAISMLPVSKFKCPFFWRKKTKNER
ncbi:hypothetical protein E3N88_16427 [Mikania micrantha]|uniref:Uncharacterized protein n=1 Tax=Mikania micrantha TaxID=192012 RepID=A0A5N6NZL9_9ASTR|nr:hypothetical protein E3N88_16427 [Mikania micrantha]